MLLGIELTLLSISASLGGGMCVLAVIKYAVRLLTNKTVRDDWIGHILLAIGLIFLVITLIAGLVKIF